jgi:hypothetical protein
LHQLAQLQKALEDPERIVDPEESKKKKEDEEKRRVEKKLQKKQELLHSLKNQKRHQKRCLKCGSR